MDYPLGLALMPVWANRRIVYKGHLEDGRTTPGLDEPIGRLPKFPSGAFAREEQPPDLPSCMARGLRPKTSCAGGGRHARWPAWQPQWPRRPRPRPRTEGNQERLPYGPRVGPKIEWEDVGHSAEGGCNGRGVQWMGVVLYNKTAYNRM